MLRMLIVDDEVGVRELLRQALAKAGYDAVTVPNAAQALEHVAKESFDLIVIDIRLSRESGIDLIARIRALRTTTPIVVYSGVLTPELEREARTAGANEVLAKDTDVLQLVERLGRIARARDRIFREPTGHTPKTILIVDDEDGVRRIIADFFRRKGYRTIEARSGEEALAEIRAGSVSVVLLDIMMPGMDGIATLSAIRAIDPRIGVIMTTGVQDEERVRKALAIGAYGYVLKPFDFLYLELVVMSKIAIAESD